MSSESEPEAPTELDAAQPGIVKVISVAVKTGKAPLVSAAVLGDVDEMKKLINRGTDVNELGSNGWTPLMGAAETGKTDAVLCLLEHNADANLADQIGSTPLMGASSAGELAAVEALVGCGADVRAANKRKWTPLHIASRWGHYRIVEYLIKNHADVNARTEMGYTPLSVAAIWGELAVVRCLLRNGADVSISNRSGSTPLMEASRSGNIKIIEELIHHGAQVNVTPRRIAGVQSVNSLIRRVSAFIWDLLLLLGMVDYGWTPLLRAASAGQHKVGWHLVKIHHADVNAFDKDGQTPLLAAAAFPNAKFVRRLVERGADVNATGADGSTPLLVAASAGHEHIVRYLLRHGSDVNASDRRGMTALMLAATNDHASVVQHLIEHNANVDAKSKHGHTAMGYAAAQGHQEVQRILMLRIHAAVGNTSRSLSELVAPPLPTWFIAPYEIELLSFISTGHYGGNYRAKWLNADVVVKLFVSDASSTTFENEVRVWRELRHPNVIKLYGACDARHQFFVCEYASNGSLVEYLKACSSECRAPWKHLYEAALGLEYLHGCGIVHGNLRCSNILVGSDGMARLADFCHTKLADTSKEGEAFRGSVRWQAPECLRGDAVSFEADVYSLGLCLVEAATGNVPWEHVDDETIGFLKMNWRKGKRKGECKGKTPGMIRAPTGLDGAAYDLMLIMCAYDPSKRLHLQDVIPSIKKLVKEAKTNVTENPASPLATASVFGLEQYRPNGDSKLLERQLRRTSMPDWFIPLHELKILGKPPLATGGFGCVRLAKWSRAKVVVKELLLFSPSMKNNYNWSSFTSSISTETQVANQDDTNSQSAEKAHALEMFKSEADIWFRSNHPNVVRLYGACHIGTPRFVCEYAANGTLVSYIRAHPEQMWVKLYEVALGVQYLHERDIVHGDLKCNNFVIGTNLKAKVTDFGLSSMGASPSASVAPVTGAWQWVAPECFNGAKPTPKSDVYSLGMCILEAMRTVEAAQTAQDDQPLRSCTPWGDLEPRVVKYYVTQRRSLPARPTSCSEDQWNLVEDMCKHDAEDRLKISAVVDKLAEFAGIEPHERCYDNLDEDVMRDVSSMTSMLNEQRAEHDAGSNRWVICSIYLLLWDRIGRLQAHIQVSGQPDRPSRFQPLVRIARERTIALGEGDDGLASFTETALRGYALHRRLDRFIEANFTRAEGEGVQAGDWKSQSYEMLGFPKHVAAEMVKTNQCRVELR